MLSIDNFLKLKDKNKSFDSYNKFKDNLKHPIPADVFEKIIKKMCTKMFTYDISTFISDCIIANKQFTHEQFNRLVDNSNMSAFIPDKSFAFFGENIPEKKLEDSGFILTIDEHKKLMLHGSEYSHKKYLALPNYNQSDFNMILETKYLTYDLFHSFSMKTKFRNKSSFERR